MYYTYYIHLQTAPLQNRPETIHSVSRGGFGLSLIPKKKKTNKNFSHSISICHDNKLSISATVEANNKNGLISIRAKAHTAQLFLFERQKKIEETIRREYLKTQIKLKGKSLRWN